MRAPNEPPAAGPPASPAPVPAPDGGGRVLERAVRVAAWSVALGIGLEVAQLAVLALQDRLPGPARALAETAGKVTWSFLVCLAIAAGLSAGRARPRAMALLGLLSAPAAFTLARSVHKGVGQALSAGAPPGGSHSPFLLAGIKALEYAVFGWIAGRLTSGSALSLRRHVGLGLGVGAATAAVLTVLHRRANPSETTAESVVRVVAEVLFPVGCACVLYVAERAARTSRARS